jgi:hypothetical protein
VDIALPDAAAGHPHADAAAVVVAPVVVLGQRALRVNRPAKFAAANHKRVLEHAALLEILQQGSHRLVDTQCLARRLLERGVRFVQLFSGGPLGGKPRTSWDGHEDMISNHTREALRIDQPVAALLKDLKQRGMLEDTLVVCGGEFGRTIYSQGALTKDNHGRDHHGRCFSMWMAGGGIRKGYVHGETDDFCYNIVRDPVHINDLNATVL